MVINKQINNKKLIVISSFCLAFALSFVIPLTVFYYNSKEFSFVWLDFLFNFGAVFSLLFLGICVLTVIVSFFTRGRFDSWVISLISAITAYFLIVNYFFPFDVGLIDGYEDPGAAGWMSFGSLKGFVVLIFLLFLSLRVQSRFREFVFILTIISIVWISFILFQGDINVFNEKEDKGDVVERALILSKNKNIIVISFDSLQSDLVGEVLRDRLDLARKFKGFTFYENVSGVAPYTWLSQLTIMLGRIPLASLKDKDLKKKIANKFIISDLSRKGYLTTQHYFSGCSPEVQTCLGIGDFSAVYFKEYYRELEILFSASLLRVLPFSVQINFPIFKLERQEAYRSIKEKVDQDSEIYKLGMNYIDFDLYKKHIKVGGEAPVAQFHHYIFTHQPIKFDKECIYQITTKHDQTRETAKGEIACALKTFAEFIENLQKMGLYDNTMLIFMSDHGYESNINSEPVQKEWGLFDGASKIPNGRFSVSRYLPLLMVKNFNASGELVFSNRPSSLLDVAPTICSVALDGETCIKNNYEGIPLDVLVNVNRSRKILIYRPRGKFVLHQATDFHFYETVSFAGDLLSSLQKTFLGLKGHRVFFPAYLPTQIGIKSGEFMRADVDKAQPGYLTYGPHILIDPGNYVIRISYRSMSPVEEEVGHWDIVKDAGRQKFSRGMIMGTKGKVKIITVPLRVDESSIKDRFEIRTFYNGKGHLEVREISLDGVQ